MPYPTTHRRLPFAASLPQRSPLRVRTNNRMCCNAGCHSRRLLGGLHGSRVLRVRDFHALPVDVDVPAVPAAEPADLEHNLWHPAGPPQHPRQSQCETMTMRWMRAMPVLSACNPTDRIGACDGFNACLHFRFERYSSSVCLDGRRTLYDRCAFVQHPPSHPDGHLCDTVCDATATPPISHANPVGL